MGENGFWDNQETAQSVVSEVKALKVQIEPIEAMFAGLDDVKAMLALASEAGDDASMQEADQMLADLETKGEKIELQSLLSGKN